ncbi:uncharacterized protein V1513DRAFT_415952 [Lipomyces chichibuensis]|uniref:uncharacterized protein n=1 Tax=Lipomyces chichibuensis TaxID=1546026 RepID=UPI0033436AB0
MPHTPLRRLVIHHDAADDNKENIPPLFSTWRTTKHGPSATLTADFKSWRDEHEHELHHGTRHSPLKTVYTTLSKSGSRMPLREIFVSGPTTPENAFVEYYIPDTSLVESPIPEPPVPRSIRRKPIAKRDSRSTTATKPNKEALAHKSTHNGTSQQRPAPSTAARKNRPALAPKAHLTSSSLAVAAKPSSTLVADKISGAGTGMRSIPTSAKPKPKSKLAQAGTKSSSGMILLR